MLSFDGIIVNQKIADGVSVQPENKSADPHETKNAPAMIKRAADVGEAARNAALADPAAVANLHVHISRENAKMGAICSVSMPPVFTCENCGGCCNFCYAIRVYNRIKEVRATYNDNLQIYTVDPVRYFVEIASAAQYTPFFRWHVSGDCIGSDYVSGVVWVAEQCPNTRFLIFTKAYTAWNCYLETAGGELPDNLQVIFSAAPGVDMPNPYKLPECHIAFADPAKDTYKGGARMVYHCTGSCIDCIAAGCGCFNIRRGDVVIINQH